MFDISIVLPTYNRLGQLQKVITALAQQTYPVHNFEVIVVSDGATDGTNELLQTYQGALNLRAMIQPNQGPAAARNCGVQAAQGDFIIFLDDDVMPTAHLLAEHLHMHQKHGDDIVVLGPMLTPADFAMAPWVRWEQAMLVKQYDDMVAGRWQPTARQFYTGNASVARRHLLAAGGFDTTFRRAEDVELAYRLANRGLTFVFNPNAIGYHYAERSFTSWLQTPYLYGRHDVIFTRDRGQTWLLPMIMHEFHQRHLMIKILTKLCLSRKRISAVVVQGLRKWAELGDQLGMEWLPKRAYSGIFNLYHYQGIADELGGRQPFFRMAAQAGSPSGASHGFLFAER